MFFCQKRRKEQIIFQQKQVKRLLAQGEKLLNPCNHVDKKLMYLCSFVKINLLIKLLFFCQKNPIVSPATPSDSQCSTPSAFCWKA